MRWLCGFKRKVLVLIFFQGFFSVFATTAKRERMKTIEEYRAYQNLVASLFYLSNLYVDSEKVSYPQLVNSAILGMLAKLDPHTSYLAKKDFERFTIGTQGHFGGVGIIASQQKKGKLIVSSPIEDTPAWRAGIKTGDQIVAIDGEFIKNMGLDIPVKKMRGIIGSKVKLTIFRKKTGKTLEFHLTREIIHIKSVKSYDLKENFWYIRIASFQESTQEELITLLTAASHHSIKGLILDLRDNPGGVLSSAVDTADCFIENGLIVSTVGRNPDHIEREFAKKRGTFSGFPMIVLVNGGSASAAEIVAGALQDHRRAVIMGVRTFGKGSVQTILPLPNKMAALKLTVARYYTPNDRSIQAKGIEPDIFIRESPSSAQKNSSMKQEADLPRHLESKEIRIIPDRFEQTVLQWPKHIQNDKQVRTAYTFLKSWSIFQKTQKPYQKSGS